MANNVISTGRIELIDLNDNRQLQLFINSSKPKTQILNANTGSYTPDWTQSNPILTPQLFLAGSSSNILNDSKSVKWFDGEREIFNDAIYELENNNHSLKIKRNMLENCLKFDGLNDYIQIETMKLNKESSSFEGWFYIRDFTPPNDRKDGAMIFSLSGGTSAYIAFIEGGITGESNTNNEYIRFGIPEITAKKWFHFAITFKNGLTSFYVNGELKGQITLEDSLSFSQIGNTSWDGQYQSSYVSYFDGLMRDLKVWNTARSQSQIIDSMDNKESFTNGELQAHWKLDDGSGNIAKDSSGNNNHGTLYGDMVWETNENKEISCEVLYKDDLMGFETPVKSSISFSKISSGKKGDKGAVGENAVMAILSNDYHGIPTTSTGVSGNYTQANSTLIIYNGGVDDSANWTVTATPSTGITGTLSGKTYSVTNMTVDTGTIEFVGKRTGYADVRKTFTVAKSKSGETGNKGGTGASATAYWLVESSKVIVRDDMNNYVPSQFTVTGKTKIGTGSPVNFAGRWVISDARDGEEYVNRYISSTNEETVVYTPRPYIDSIRVRLYLENGTTLIDEAIINIVNYGNEGYIGQDAINALAWTPNGNTIKNGEGEITAKADLYKGSEIAQGSNYRWVRENPEKTSVIAGAGWEDLDYGKDNILPSSDFEKLSPSPYVGKNENLYANFWGGYNGGINNPTTSYHAHIDVNTFGYPVYEYNESDGNRHWKGVAPSIDYIRGTGEYTVSADVYSTGQGTVLDGGFYYYKIGSDSPSFYSGKFYFYPSEINKWNRMSQQITLGQDVDLTKPIRFYFYGYNFSSNSILYMKNPKVEKGAVATTWNKSNRDIFVQIDQDNFRGENLINVSDIVAHGSSLELTSEKYQQIPVMRNTVNRPDAQNNFGLKLKSAKSFTQRSGDFNLSFNFKIIQYIHERGMSGRISVRYTDGETQTFTFNNIPLFRDSEIQNKWQRYDFNFSTNESKELSAITEVYFWCDYSPVGNEVLYTPFKLELGTKATGWIPSKEDADLYTNSMIEGKDSWIYGTYENPLTESGYLVDYDIIKESTQTETLVIGDNATFTGFKENELHYMRTAVYSDEEKIFNLLLSQSNTIMVYINGVSAFNQNAWLEDGVPIRLKSGWNTIELTWVQGNPDDPLEIQNSLASQVDEMNCYYALKYGELRGIDGVRGSNTESLTITADSITNIETFKCFIDDNGISYSDICVVHDVSDPFSIVLMGTSVFKNGQGESAFTAKLFRDGLEIDADDSMGLTYKWYIYNSDDSLHSTWNDVGYKLGKTITVHADDITVEGRLTCEVDK